MSEQQKKLWFDLMAYGSAAVLEGVRKWYNPMRWIKGKKYTKYIDITKLYLQPKDDL
jgi:hypothetical protein